uniref:Uncharacterized protein n=2 Tax=Panagrolaimus superbus TaxID=310955 RepID=A0A914YFD7_9BILA
MDDSVEDKGTETQSSNATFTEDLSNNLSLPPSNNTQRQYDTSSSSYNDVIGWNDATVTRSFDEIVEDFLQMLLETNLEELDSFEIRKFSLEIPRSYRPLRSNYSLIFEILFKIKDINNRAVFNDTLTFINKVFDGVDFNQFLLHFWQDLKRRNISPIGFSFTQGKPMFDYGDVNYNSIGQAIFGVKAIEILRRLPCLGDFMVDDGLGKEIPIFLFYIELLLNDPKVQRNRDLYGSTLSLMVSVAWTPRSLT